MKKIIITAIALMFLVVPAFVLAEERNVTPKSLDEFNQIADALQEGDTVNIEYSYVDVFSCAEKLSELAARGVTVHFNTELCGVRISDDATSLNFNGIRFENLDAFYQMLPLMPNLTSLEMCGCGINNGRMDKLRNAFPNAGIVWTIETKHWTVRTDAKYFATWVTRKNEDGLIIEALNIEKNTNADLDWLTYCHDLVALDVGHNSLENIDFVRNMPNLRYLIIADNQVASLEPLSGLTELYYLEIFNNPIKDLSPMANLTKLEHFNMCYVPAKDVTPIDNLPLKRLWLSENFLSMREAKEVKKYVQSLHPECDVQIAQKGDFTGYGWRGCDIYYEMREALGWAPHDVVLKSK